MVSFIKSHRNFEKMCLLVTSILSIVALLSLSNCSNFRGSGKTQATVVVRVSLPQGFRNTFSKLLTFEERLPISRIYVQVFDSRNVKVFERNFSDLNNVSFEMWFVSGESYNLNVQLYTNGSEYNNVETKVVEGTTTFQPLAGNNLVTIPTNFVNGGLRVEFSLPEEIQYDHRIVAELITLQNESSPTLSFTLPKIVDATYSVHELRDLKPGIWRLNYEATRVNLETSSVATITDTFYLEVLPNKMNRYSYVVRMAGDEDLIGSDPTPPSIQILSPASGTLVRETETPVLSITARASDESGLAKAELWLGTVKVDERYLNLATQADVELQLNLINISKQHFGNQLLRVYAQDRRNNRSSQSLGLVLDLKPYVRILSPSSGTVFGTTTIMVEATASDYSGIQRVDIFSGSTKLATLTTAPYATLVALPLTETQIIRAVATDMSGEQQEDACLILRDLYPPSITVLSPSSGSEFPTIQVTTVPITVEATDDFGVAKVELFVAGNKVAETSNTSLSYNWDISGMNLGFYEIAARAFDTVNNVSQASSAIKIVVFDDFESATRYLPNYTTGGNATPERVYHSGRASNVMRVGNISHSQSTWFEFRVTTNSRLRLSFDYQVSSEAGWDFFRLYVNSSEVFRDSGIKDWITKNDIVLEPGSHVLRFAYTTDGSVLMGDNCVYIDNIRLTPIN